MLFAVESHRAFAAFLSSLEQLILLIEKKVNLQENFEMSSQNIEQLYSGYATLLDQRLSYQRRTVEFSLIPYSGIIVDGIAISNDEYIRFLLDERIDEILKDCEIYYEMSKDKAYDAMGELSNYAAIYCEDMSSPIYKKICNLIKNIIVSYPISY
jgi:hypothetical protein